MNEEQLKKALQEYVSTYKSGKYSTWEEINSKFPEFNGFDKKALQEYVSTYESGKYSTWDDINSKFPEFFTTSQQPVVAGVGKATEPVEVPESLTGPAYTKLPTQEQYIPGGQEVMQTALTAKTGEYVPEAPGFFTSLGRVAKSTFTTQRDLANKSLFLQYSPLNYDEYLKGQVSADSKVNKLRDNPLPRQEEFNTMSLDQIKQRFGRSNIYGSTEDNKVSVSEILNKINPAADKVQQFNQFKSEVDSSIKKIRSGEITNKELLEKQSQRETAGIPATFGEGVEKGFGSYLGRAIGSAAGSMGVGIVEPISGPYKLTAGEIIDIGNKAAAENQGITEREWLESGKKLDSNAAIEIGGLISSALEYVGLGKVAAPVLKRFVKEGVKEGIKKGIVGEAAGAAATEAAKKATVGQVAKTAVVEGAKGGATEMSTEFLQSIDEQVSGQLAAGVKPENISINWADAWESGLQGAIGGGGISTVSSVAAQTAELAAKRSKRKKIEDAVNSVLDKVADTGDPNLNSTIDVEAYDQERQVGVPSVEQQGAAPVQEGVKPESSRTQAEAGGVLQVSPETPGTGQAEVTPEAKPEVTSQLTSEEKEVALDTGIGIEDAVPTRLYFDKPSNTEKNIPSPFSEEASKLINIIKPTAQTVKITDIIPTQLLLEKGNFEKIKDTDRKTPLLFKDKDGIFVVDGHHRITAEKLSGNQNITARVFDLTTATKEQLKAVEELLKGTQPTAEQQVTEQPLVEQPVAESISDQEYNDFVDKGTVSPQLISSIADKVKANETLSARENAIFTNKTAEINNKIRETTPVTPEQPAVLSKEQINVNSDATNFAQQMQSAQASLGSAGVSVTPYSQQEYNDIAREGGKFFRAAGNKVLAVLKPNGEIVSLVKDASVKAKGAAQAVISKMKEMGGTFMDNYDIYLTPIYQKAGFKVVARVPFDPQYAPSGWNATDSPLKNQPDVVFMVREDLAPAQEKQFTSYEDAQNYVKGLVEKQAVPSEGVKKETVTEETEKQSADKLMEEGTQELESAVGVTPTAKKDESEIRSAVATAQKAIQKLGIKIELLDADSYVAKAKQLGADVSKGMFVSNEGKIYINSNLLAKSIGDNRVIWHESAHPIINIIHNTDRKLYNKVISGLKKAAKTNEQLQVVEKWANDAYKGQEVLDDEFLVEVIANIADGRLDITQLDGGLRQAIVELINKIAKALGLGEVLSDTDVIAFKNLATQISEALINGTDVSQIVGENNIAEYGSSLQEPVQLKKVTKIGEKLTKKTGSFALSYVKPKDIIDINKLVKEIANKGQKVWFWAADQLGRGEYYDKVIGTSHYLDAGPSFALDPNNREKKIIWATGKGEKWVTDKIKNSDYIFIISGSPLKSKLFNRRVAEITINRIKAVAKENTWDKFKSDILAVSKITALNDLLNEFNSFEELLASPQRKQFLIEIDAQKEKKGTDLKKKLEEYNAFVDYNELRDGFYKDNDFKLNDIMLVLRPKGYGGKSAHSTYENDILGEVVGVPDAKINAFDLMPDEFKSKYSEDISRTEQSQAVAPYGAGIRTIQYSRSEGPQLEKTNKSEIAKAYSVPLSDKEINTIRASLRMKAPEGYTLQVLDQLQEAKKNDNLAVEDIVNDFLDNGITLNDIGGLVLEDETVTDKQSVINYLNSIPSLSPFLLKQTQLAKGRKLTENNKIPVTQSLVKIGEAMIRKGEATMGNVLEKLRDFASGNYAIDISPIENNIMSSLSAREALRAREFNPQLENEQFEETEFDEEDSFGDEELPSRMAAHLSGKVVNASQVKRFVDVWNQNNPDRTVKSSEVWNKIDDKAVDEEKIETTLTKILQEKARVKNLAGKNAMAQFKDIITYARDAVKQNKLTWSQSKAILNRLKGITYLTPERVLKVKGFIDKIVTNAQYSQKVHLAQKLAKKLRKPAKNASANIKNLAKKLSQVEITDDNLDEFISHASVITNSFARPDTERYSPVKEADVEIFIDTQRRIQENEMTAALINAASQNELTKADLNQADELNNPESEVTSVDQIVEENAQGDIDKQKQTRDNLIAIAEGMKEALRMHQSSNKDKDVMLTFNPTKASLQTIVQYIKAVNNIILNNNYSGIGNMVTAIQKQNTVKDAIDNIKSKMLGRPRTKPVAWLGFAASLQQTYDQILRGSKAASDFLRWNGLGDYVEKQAQFTNESTKMAVAIENAINEINKKYKTNVQTADNQTRRRVLSELAKYINDPTANIPKVIRNIEGDIKELIDANNPDLQDLIDNLYGLLNDMRDKGAVTYATKPYTDPISGEVRYDGYEFSDGDIIGSSDTVVNYFQKNHPAVHELWDFFRNKVFTDDLYNKANDVNERWYNETMHKYKNYSATVFRKIGEGITSEEIYPKTTLRPGQSNRFKEATRNRKRGYTYSYIQSITDDINAYNEILHDIYTTESQFTFAESMARPELVAKDGLFDGRTKDYMIRDYNKRVNVDRKLEGLEVVQLALEGVTKVAKNIANTTRLLSLRQPISQWLPAYASIAVRLGKKAYLLHQSVPKSFEENVISLVPAAVRDMKESFLNLNERFSVTDKQMNNWFGKWYGKGLGGAERASKKLSVAVLNPFVGKPDFNIYKRGWVALYVKNLQDQGVDVVNLEDEGNLQDDEKRIQARQYATFEMEKMMAPSTATSKAELWKQRGFLGSAITNFLPFGSFTVNFKQRLLTAYAKIDSKEGVQELSSAMTEAAVFSAIAVAWANYFTIPLARYVAANFLGYEMDEEEEDETFLGINWKSFSDWANRMYVDSIPFAVSYGEEPFIALANRLEWLNSDTELGFDEWIKDKEEKSIIKKTVYPPKGYIEMLSEDVLDAYNTAQNRYNVGKDDAVYVIKNKTYGDKELPMNWRLEDLAKLDAIMKTVGSLAPSEFKTAFKKAKKEMERKERKLLE